jgi:hypothetical protein
MHSTLARLAIVVTALFSVTLISFPSFPNTLVKASKPQEIARALKGDRLTNIPAKNEQSLERAGKQMPVGCDRAFSSMSGPQSSQLFGRCLV